MATLTTNPSNTKTCNSHSNSHRWIKQSNYQVIQMPHSSMDNHLGNSSRYMADTKRYRILTKTTLEPINKITKQASQSWGSMLLQSEVEGRSSCSLCILTPSTITSIMQHLIIIRFKQSIPSVTIANEFHSMLYIAAILSSLSLMILYNQPILVIPTCPLTHSTKTRWLQDFLLQIVTVR